MKPTALRLLDLQLWRASLQVAQFALRVGNGRQVGRCARCEAVGPLGALLPTAVPLESGWDDRDLGFCGECIEADLHETRQQLARALQERKAEEHGDDHRGSGATG